MSGSDDSTTMSTSTSIDTYKFFATRDASGSPSLTGLQKTDDRGRTKFYSIRDGKLFEGSVAEDTSKTFTLNADGSVTLKEEGHADRVFPASLTVFSDVGGSQAVPTSISTGLMFVIDTSNPANPMLTGLVKVERGREKTYSIINGKLFELENEDGVVFLKQEDPNKTYSLNPDGTVTLTEEYATRTEAKVFTLNTDGIVISVVSSSGGSSQSYSDDDVYADDHGGRFSGGFGDDRLFSGSGDDDLYGDQGDDTASYAEADSAVTVSLANSGKQNTGHGKDRLIKIERLEGSGFDDELTGSKKGDTIKGGAGDDRLSGNGGRDDVSGGDDSDTFVFNVAVNGKNVLNIMDFSSADDQIELDDKFFKGVSSVNLNGSLVFGDRAVEADDRLIANSVGGGFELYYDRDGSGGKAAVLVATIVGVLNVSDFSVV